LKVNCVRSQLHSGFEYYAGFLDRAAQEAILATLEPLLESAPFYRPSMPKTGKPLSVRMTNLGSLGWVSDQAGYRYQATHPVNGLPWPAIPQALLDIWAKVSGYDHPPQACLVNLYQNGAKMLYQNGAKMGLHRDEDEEDRDAPVVSISLGDSAIFRLGGPERSGPTSSLKLTSGDVVVLGGPSRHFYHGIDRVLAGSSSLVPGGGRINLTMRVVRPHG
jgi:alkylated DNA repair protein (DNA oxidative demethylase)